MTDLPPSDPTAPEGQVNGADQPGGPSLRVIAQFIRDLSFENPRAPDSLRTDQGSQPQAEIGLELNVRGRPDQLFEVDIKLNVAAKKDGQTNFALELVYGGLFQIEGASEQDLEPILFIECPRVLFPFARRIVADCVTDGGFPPFPLDPIDFAGLYMSQRGAIQGNRGGQPAVGNA